MSDFRSLQEEKMKVFLAILLLCVSLGTAKADEEALNEAVSMTAMVVVYLSECKPAEDVKKQLRSVAQLHQAAAGVDGSNRQFAALTMIKAIKFTEEAKTIPHFCQKMETAFKEGQQN